MKTRTQFILTLSFFGLLLIGMAASLLLTNQQVDRLRQQEEIAHRIEQGAIELSHLSGDYLMYGENQQRARWESSFASFSEDVSRLNPANPEQQTIADHIRTDQARLQAVFTDVVSALEESAQTSGGAPDPEFSQVSWSRMEVQNRGMAFEASLLMQRLRDQADRLKRMNLVLIFALIDIFGVYLLINYYLIYQRTLRSIADLQAGIAIIGSGNLDFTIAVKRADEIGELSRAFNRMTANLKEVTASKADLEREIAERERAEVALHTLNAELEQRVAEQSAEILAANKSLEQRVAARTVELQTANENLRASRLAALNLIEDITKAQEQVERLNRMLNALSDSNQAMMRAVSEADYLDEVCRIIVEDCGHAMVWIGYADDDEQKSVRPVASAGFEAGNLESLKITWADTERGRSPTGTAIRTRKLSRCRNMLTDPQYAPWREEALICGYASSIVLPLVIEGQAIGALSIYSKEPDPFSEAEEQLLTELVGDLAYGIAAIRLQTAHARAEEALRASEERYRALFANMTEGFALHEIICDERGDPYDYRFLEINPSFERLTGIKRDEAMGRWVSEVLPGVESYWIKTYGEVALTGQPVHFENYSEPLDRHYEVYAYRPAPRQFAVLFMDVTERKRAEEAVRHAAAEWEQTFDNVPDLIAILDSQHRVLRANRAMAQRLGLTSAQIVGATCFRAVHSLNAPPAFCPHSRALAERHETMAEIHEERLGGDFIVTCTPLFDDNGRVTRTVHVARDITERKRAEEALRVSEDKFATVFRFSPDAIGIVRATDGIMLDVNEAFSRLLEYSRSEIIGKHWRELSFVRAADQRYGITELFLQEGKVIDRELDFVTREDRVATVLLSLSNIVIDGEACILAIAHDITGHRRAEKALHESEEKVTKVLESIQELTSVWEVIRNQQGEIIERRLVQANRSFLRLAEATSLDKIRGKIPGEIFGSVWVEGNLPFVREAMDTGAMQTFEWQVKGHHYLTTICPIDEKSFLATGTDITVVKEAEETLRRVQAELAQRLQERAAQEERQRLARELHDSVSQALYGISLGVHTALMVLETDQDKVREALKYTLSLTSAGLTEMRALIFELRPESLEQEGLVAALTKQTAALRARYGIEVALSVCDEPNLPLAVKEELYRIAQEALQNAIKHAHADRLDVRLVCEPSGLWLEVCDNGVGFDPLASFPGHLGLRSMRERATRMGGELRIVSAPDCGTQLRAYIPIPVPQAG